MRELTQGCRVNLNGRLFCVACGLVASKGGSVAIFLGRANGCDVFELLNPISCPWCGALNEMAKRPCTDNVEEVLKVKNEWSLTTQPSR